MFEPRHYPKPEDFGDLFLPGEAAQPILAKPVRAALFEWLTEIWAAADLEAVGLKPRRRAIFDGPPGVGKTTLAHHLAARLGLTMLAVRPERLIDKYVGSTGRNIGDLFDCVGDKDDGEPIVLFLDEFDALAAQRNRAESGAEQHRNEAVNVLLQRIEQHDGFLIAATNFGERIDTAIWRRFDIHIALELPGPFEREQIAARYLEPFGMPREALEAFGESLSLSSPALIRAFCENLKRQLVLGPLLKMPMGKGEVVDRVLASCHPHPDAGKPELWSKGAASRGVALMPWPLPLAADVVDAEPPARPAPARGEVVDLRRRP